MSATQCIDNYDVCHTPAGETLVHVDGRLWIESPADYKVFAKREELAFKGHVEDATEDHDAEDCDQEMEEQYEDHEQYDGEYDEEEDDAIPEVTPEEAYQIWKSWDVVLSSGHRAEEQAEEEQDEQYEQCDQEYLEFGDEEDDAIPEVSPEEARLIWESWDDVANGGHRAEEPEQAEEEQYERCDQEYLEFGDEEDDAIPEVTPEEAYAIWKSWDVILNAGHRAEEDQPEEEDDTIPEVDPEEALRIWESWEGVPCGVELGVNAAGDWVICVDDRAWKEYVDVQME